MSNKLSQTSKQAERVKAYYMRIINANQESFGRQMKERDVKYKAVEKQWIQDAIDYKEHLKRIESHLVKVSIAAVILGGSLLGLILYSIWN